MSANLFQQYLQPPRSAFEYANDFARADLEREQLAGARQANALNAMTLEQKRAEQADAAETRNALQRVAATWTADTKPADRIASLRNTGRAALIAQADAIEKAELDASKTRSEVGKREGETLDATMARYRGALDFIDTREGAARWLQAQYSDPVLGQYMQRLGTFEQAVQKLPTDPQAFQQWRQQAAMGMQKFVEQQTQRRGQDVTVRGQDITDARTREEGALNRGVQIRGQNMVNDRARDQNAIVAGELRGPSAPILGVPMPAVTPWQGQTNQRDANKVKAAEFNRGAKEVEKDTEAASKERSTADAARRFLEINQRVNTGGLTDRMALTRSLQAMGSDYGELEAITARLAPGMREPGSGATSDYDGKQFERATVGVDKKRTTNENIAKGIIARAQQSQDYAEFRNTYLEQNGTLSGADRYWRQYANSNPIFRPGGKDFELNTGRQGWREFFANGQAPAAPSAAPAARPPAADPAQPYTDAEKERRYQEWKRRQEAK
jgi:hypothetical protein